MAFSSILPATRHEREPQLISVNNRLLHDRTAQKNCYISNVTPVVSSRQIH